MKINARILLIPVFCLMLAAPHLAEARAGGGSSLGSRGAHTYQALPEAEPIGRSVAPYPAQPAYTSPGYNPGYNPGYSSGFGLSSHPFLTSIAGGFLGAGLAGMLFGHSAYADGMVASPAGGAFGGMLQLLLIGGLGYMAYRWFTNRPGGTGFGVYQNQTPSLDAPFNTQPALTPRGTNSFGEAPLSLASDDTQAFQQLLPKIQMAWGAGDLNHMRQYVTPEMLQYFSETLSANSSRGLINRIENVGMPETRLIESWSEEDLDYATVQMKWRAVDYMARLDAQPGDSNYIASGDATQPVEAQEIWTFARARDGGRWLLSAIQQMNQNVNAA